ncbi:MAG: AAA family ATPase [Acidimicrobiales bacterium]
MRPERLLVEGFAPFRDPTEIDFRDVELFALVGSTGAGKSSVIDAVCFALYGIVPRYADRRVVAPVVTQGAVEARVLLDFSVGSEHWRAVRVVRLQGGAGRATTKEARLERLAVAGDEAGEVVAGTADELTAAVTDLLGLTYEHFTTCVVLPQGEFARFLHDKPAERQGLLVELLGLGVYEQMAGAARSRAQVAKAKADLVAEQLGALAAYTPELQAELEDQRDRAVALLARIDEAEPGRVALVEAERAAATEAEDADERAATLARVQVPDGVADIGARRQGTAAALAEARAVEDAATAAVGDAEATVAAAGSRADLEALRRDHEERAAQAARIPNGEQKLAGATAAAEAADAARDAAVAAHAAAAARLEAARTADRARELAATLTVGEPCPVCGHEVVELPTHELADLRALEGEAAAAAGAVEEATERAADARRTADRYEALLDEVRATVAALDDRLAGRPSAAEADATLLALAAAEEALDAARRADAAARRATRAAEDAARAAEADERRARGSFDSARDAVAVPGRRSPSGPTWRPTGSSWRHGRRRATRRAGGRRGGTVASVDGARRAPRPGAGPGRRRGRARDRAGHGPRRDAVVKAVADREADVVSVIDGLAVKAERRPSWRGCAATRRSPPRCGRYLDARHFRGWMIDEALQRLVVGATELLQTLSDGAYSLTLDDKATFCVVDHRNAGAVRSVRTLSGGENLPHLAGAGLGAGGSGRPAGVHGRRAAGVGLPRRGLRHARPRRARHRRRRARRARRHRSPRRRHHPRARAGRAHAGALRGGQGRHHLRRVEGRGVSDPGPPGHPGARPTPPGMRFAVETWAPEYGAPSGEEAVLAESTSEVDAWAECGPEQWRPLDPPPGAVAPDRLLFVDGCAGSRPRCGSPCGPMGAQAARATCTRRCAPRTRRGGVLRRHGSAGRRRGAPQPAVRSRRRPSRSTPGTAASPWRWPPPTSRPTSPCCCRPGWPGWRSRWPPPTAATSRWWWSTVRCATATTPPAWWAS